MLTDVRLRDGDGFDLLEQCRRNWPASQVILMTGYGTPDGAIEAIRAGAFDYITKPLIDNELLMTIERAISQRNVRQENDNLRAQLDRRYGMDNIVGRDPRMLKVFEMISSVADTRATVLVTGESGTGKSMIARAIHRRSGRAKGPFVEVACGALPETLLESELFGHVAGAFTGAAGEKMGKFLQADGGTIFLDEIGTCQPRDASETAPRAARAEVRASRRHQDILGRCSRRAGDERRPLAGGRRRPLPAGFVLPHQRDQHRAAAAAFPRERYLDTGPQFLGASPRRLSPRSNGFRRRRDGDARATTTWPGNVRELQNVVERAVLLGKGPVITVADLPAEVRGSNSIVYASTAGQKTLKEALEGPERQIIREVLESNGWNRNATADQLGINRTTLYKKMKRLGLEDGRVGVM